MNNENNQIVVRTSASPFRDSFMGTIGGGFGIFLLAGIPMLFVGGTLFFIGWKVYKSIAKSKNVTTRDSLKSEIFVNDVSGTKEEIEVKLLEEKRRIKSKSKKSSDRIVK